MLWTALFILILLFDFVIFWKRDGITQTILNFTGLASIYFAFFNTFNNGIHNTIFLLALIIGIVSLTISFTLWWRARPRK
jgi:hypothetical protein